MISNIVIDTDAYKITHHLQRPSNLTYFYSYGEPREGGYYNHVMFFGLNYIIQNYFKVPTLEDIKEGKGICEKLFGTNKYFNEEVWLKVAELGYLPLIVKGVREGTLVKENNVCFTIESTEPWFAPMVSHFEDFLMHVWYPTAVATRGTNIKSMLIPLLGDYCGKDINSLLPYMVTDFGLRGGAGYEAAILGGMAHLVNFKGTDNIPAIHNILKYYPPTKEALDDGYIVGGSVWATEHSVATVWGKDNEVEYLRAQLYRGDTNLPVSIVIDSYDADNFTKNVVMELREDIINRPGRVVFRPDSGEVLPSVLLHLSNLEGVFGTTINSCGLKVLNHNVGLIQGDGMNELSIPTLYYNIAQVGWAPENIVVGSGGGLLVEGLSRDTNRWAVKCSYAEVDGESINVSKTPKTDMTKASKSGKLKLVEESFANFSTISSSFMTKEEFDSYEDSMIEYYNNGSTITVPFDEITRRAGKYINYFSNF